jgi:rubrerythrin
MSEFWIDNILSILLKMSESNVLEEGPMDWVTFLSVMIEDERAAIAKYRVALEKADSEPLRAVLERLMHEEEFHVDFLEQEIRRLQAV